MKKVSDLVGVQRLLDVIKEISSQNNPTKLDRLIFLKTANDSGMEVEEEMSC